MLVAVAVTLLLMRFATPRAIRGNLVKQFAVFRNKHNWIMTWLYTMTFGSFIGYSAAFPKLIADVFGYVRVDANGVLLAEPQKLADAPNALTYAFLGALVGSLVRPVGGWLSDRFGGARVTHWDTWVMIASAIGVAWCVMKARFSPDPGTWFMPFLLLFLLLFVTTGIGNGSTFRMIPIIFPKEQAGPVLGWTSAIAAYGAFLIPTIFATQIKAGTPEYALYGFVVYYVSCLAVNWWYYARAARRLPAEDTMSRLTITMVLVAGIGGCLLILTATAGSWHLPGNNQGYEPVQPIAFSHHLHAGELGIQCLYCHHGAEVSRTAGLPAAETCLNCHRFVTAPLSLMRQEDEAAQKEKRQPRPVVSDELKKLYDALAVDDNDDSRPAAAAADRMGAGPRPARFRVLRPPGSRACGRHLPRVPRAGRDDGAGAAVPVPCPWAGASTAIATPRRTASTANRRRLRRIVRRVTFRTQARGVG